MNEECFVSGSDVGERVLLDRREGVHVRGVSEGERGGSVQGSCVCEGSVVSEGDVW